LHETIYVDRCEVLAMTRPTIVQFLWGIALLLISSATLADTLKGRVVRVVDGDTIVLLVSSADGEKREEKTRLAGTDAPESGQPWGRRAKQALSGYVFGQDVTIEWSKRDRYDRVVGKILDGERDVNLAMVRDGMAWWYRKYASEQSLVDRNLYEAAETTARAARVGLWTDPNPIPPWDFRPSAKQTPPPATAPGGCPCEAGVELCTGAKGGRYCMRADGSKHYHHAPRPN
jgi:micrococcal nuclease